MEVVTEIKAPAARCFDLARDLDLHVKSMANTGERAVAGRTSGLIGLGEEVTWEAKHLGVTQRFTSRITGFSRPRHFRDEMVRGAFKSFVHDHHFEEHDGVTTMRDVLWFRSPFGVVGNVVDRAFMARYLKQLLTGRAKWSKGRQSKRMARLPNPRLQRTPSASPPSPLSRPPLGRAVGQEWL